ncbi:pseudouridine synthase [Candidatus Tisiphia endosymbiont of Nemotelus uliginosus]|uniref:pseudouridine synthase n=1 Tax=Candidatus Tisiphia endosymbiont of Nemotelus uliginosus TaxID=3077926 RepID=UPI0035C8BCED
MQRLAKVISNAGICSRRDAEDLIRDNQVKVDGMIITSPAIKVTNISIIEVSGRVIHQTPLARLWRYYKPVGLVTTHKDTHDRNTVFANLPGLPRVISIGRLDLNSEGLLLLTNNGGLARQFELPSTKMERIYKVRAYGRPALLLQNYQNITIDQVKYYVKSIKLVKTSSANSWFEVALTEGKNREIRRIFEYFGLKVNRLIRVQYGDFVLGNLQPNEYQEVERRQFMQFL